MSGFKGTPGPWAVSYADNPKHGSSWGGYWQIDAQYDAVACNQFCFAGINKPDVSEANAHLLAAAPDLLAALQQFVNGVETGMIESVADETLANITRQARAAISKALGEGEKA